MGIFKRFSLSQSGILSTAAWLVCLALLTTAMQAAGPATRPQAVLIELTPERKMLLEGHRVELAKLSERLQTLTPECGQLDVEIHVARQTDTRQLKKVLLACAQAGVQNPKCKPAPKPAGAGAILARR